MARKKDGDGKQGTLADLWLAPTAPKRTRRTPQKEAAPTTIQPPAVPPLTPAARRIWSVRDLATATRQQVEREYQDIWVEGEISNCRIAPSGHIYFTLKDGEAQLPVVLFRRQATLLRFRPADGLLV